MKVLLIKDVYKLGRAGDIKKVANGYGRNYLIPQGLAVLATPGAVKQADRIREEAEVQRAAENKELGGLAEQLADLKLFFAAKAGETGKLYGSVTTQMIAESINEELGSQVEKRQVDTQPIRMLGVHMVDVRLTIDLIPEITVLVHREGEPPESAYAFVEGEEVEAPITEAVREIEAEEAEELIEEAGAASDEIEAEDTVAEEAAVEAEVEDEAEPETGEGEEETE